MKKNTTTTPVCIYRNLEHENKTRQELSQAQKAMQRLFNEWLKLKLGPIDDISDLLMKPKITYDQAVEKLVQVPEMPGPFKLLKSKYKDQLSLPDPAGILTARNEALELTYSAIPELFNIEGDQVVLNQLEADNLIDSQSVYCNDPDKVKLVKDIEKLIDLMNSVNKSLNNDLLNASPWLHNWIRGKFELKQYTVNGLNEISIIPEYLRRLVQS